MSAPSSYNPSSSSYNPSGFVPSPHYNHYISNYNPTLPPQPSMPSSYNNPSPPSYAASLVGRTTPIPSSHVPMPTPAIPSVRPSFVPPPSSFKPAAAPPRPHIPPTPSIASTPTFSNSHTPHGIPPSMPPSIPSSWTAPHSQPPSLPPSLQRPPLPSSISPSPAIALPPSFENPYLVRSAVAYTIPHPVDPGSFRFPTSNPFISLPTPTFAVTPILPPSLSGPAQWVSSFPSFQATLPSRRLASWAPPSMERTPPLPSNHALVPLPRNYSFSWQPQGAFTFKADAQTQQTYRRQFEQNLKMFCQLDAPPERPFPTWQTLGVSQFAFQVDRHTTLFVDPATLTEFFQRASPAQRYAMQAQLVSFMERTVLRDRVSLHSQPSPSVEHMQNTHVSWIDRLDQKAHELGLRAQSKIAHALWDGTAFAGKVAAELGDAALRAVKPLVPDNDLQKMESLSEKARRTVESGHQRIDEFFGTKEHNPNPLPERNFIIGVIPLPGAGILGKTGQAGRVAQAVESAGVLGESLVVEESALINRPVSIIGKATTTESRVGSVVNKALTTEETLSSTTPIIETEATLPGFVGSKNFQLKQPEFQKVSINPPTRINERLYSGHAIDKMQLQGIQPSLIEDVIKNGEVLVGKEPNTKAFFYKEHNLTVILNDKGDVVTTSFGKIKQ